MEVFAEVTGNIEILGKGIMMGFGMLGPALAIGMIGNAVMTALSRNPESQKFIGQILVIIALAELLALLVFASLFII